jgi:hypothetical protein
MTSFWPRQSCADRLSLAGSRYGICIDAKWFGYRLQLSGCSQADRARGGRPPRQCGPFVFGIGTTKLEMLRSPPPLSRRALEQVEPISPSQLCYWSKPIARLIARQRKVASPSTGPQARGIYLDISVAIQRPPFSQSSRNPGGKRTAMMMTLVLEVYGVLIFSTIAFLAIAWASSRESRKQID